MSRADLFRIRPEDHVLGRRSASVSLMEYGDYQCPFCREAHYFVLAVLREVGDGVAFVFRNFPLTNVHPFAEMAAEAAESAGIQGKFWEMHNGIYENQDELGPDLLVDLAGELKLDLDQFEKDLANGACRERVRRDFTMGVRSGVNGTPSFFINGTRYDGSRDVSVMVDTLRRSMQESQPLSW